MTLRLKTGVRLYGLQPEMLYCLDRCVDLWPDGASVTVTSARGDKHSRQSLHYSGNAVDLRTRDITDAQIREVILKLRQVLGARFDVIYEGNHLHLEHQPKDAHKYLTGLPT